MVASTGTPAPISVGGLRCRQRIGNPAKLSQGSQFGEVVVSLPSENSRLLTRELLYTAVTRASRRVTVVGEEPVIRMAVERSVQRASGLRSRLWA